MMRRRVRDGMLERLQQAAGRSSGFTLLEMVVTLTILGFILLIIFGAFRLGLSAWDKGESSREEYQRVRMVSQMVSRQLKSIVPYKVKTEKAEGDYLAFEGQRQAVKFVSALSIKARQPEGFVYGAYEFKEGGNEGGRLVIYEQRVLNKNFFEERPKEESGSTLIEGISSVRFEYYREADPEKNRTEERRRKPTRAGVSEPETPRIWGPPRYSQRVDNRQLDREARIWRIRFKI